MSVCLRTQSNCTCVRFPFKSVKEHELLEWIYVVTAYNPATKKTTYFNPQNLTSRVSMVFSHACHFEISGRLVAIPIFIGH